MRLRQLIASHDDLRRKIEDLEEKYDEQFAVVFDAIRQLMEDPDEDEADARPRIGYQTEGVPATTRSGKRSRAKVRTFAT